MSQMRWGGGLLTSPSSLDKVILETHMPTLTGTDVGCFHSSAQESDKEWSGAGWVRPGERAARRADGRAADGLGCKSGSRGLPFLDGSLPDALW